MLYRTAVVTVLAGRMAPLWNFLKSILLGHAVSHNMQVLEDMRHALGPLAEENFSANSKKCFCPVCLVILTL